MISSSTRRFGGERPGGHSGSAAGARTNGGRQHKRCLALAGLLSQHICAPTASPQGLQQARSECTAAGNGKPPAQLQSGPRGGPGSMVLMELQQMFWALAIGAVVYKLWDEMR